MVHSSKCILTKWDSFPGEKSNEIYPLKGQLTISYSVDGVHQTTIPILDTVDRELVTFPGVDVYALEKVPLQPDGHTAGTLDAEISNFYVISQSI